jgi:DNA-binding CsgD family transcriptional regulator
MWVDLGMFLILIKFHLQKRRLMSLVVLANGHIDYSPLTARERDVIALWAAGLQQKEIAVRLGLSPGTVKKHLRNVYLKLNAHNKVQALTKAGYL